MAANKRITELSNYTSILPYSSELFGVYQPLIGWKSKRTMERLKNGIRADNILKFKQIQARYKGIAQLINTDLDVNQAINSARLSNGQRLDFRLGVPRTDVPKIQNDSILLEVIANALKVANLRPVREEWAIQLTPEKLNNFLNTEVLAVYSKVFEQQLNEFSQALGLQGVNDPELLEIALQDKRESLQKEILLSLEVESAIAGAIDGYVTHQLFDKLDTLFFRKSTSQNIDDLAGLFDSMQEHFDDPYLTFDPKKDVSDVSLSPVGIVHLYRQYFFELDTFLGTPVEHVWLSPGSTVEMIESSSRRTMTEKIVETFLESSTKEEVSNTQQDDISEVVKQDNKSDMKLGFSTTVNQSWGTGNASATGSLNLENTQQVAREQGHKRMRQQSEKLSSEIRQSFKTSFKVVTETNEVSSKRHVLTNNTKKLINYELRRKMRQVGVQVQDVGSYLCWETFVDDPGNYLGLPNLVHIAQPADMIMVPDPKLIPMPAETLYIGFTGEMVWNFPSNESQHGENHSLVRGRFVPLNTIEIQGVPPDYEIIMDPKNPFINITKSVIAAEDDESWNANNWGALGMITADKRQVIVGITTMPKPGGLAWDDRITFKVNGAVTCRLLEAKRTEINTANTALRAGKQAADAENKRKYEEELKKAAKDRITLSSKIKKRKFEDLREEERTIVYRNLIRSLMTTGNYDRLPENSTGHRARHVLSELINSIFDINKMLYFVAPEWWKPRKPQRISLGNSAIQNSINDSIVNWPDHVKRDDNYFITEESEPAPMGSSLGWLLQLDGDSHRNAFLNAPWVKSVIPIRPGKELAAINWLQNAGVEGADGLDANYTAPQAELDEIRATLLENNPNDPVKDHPKVILNDAIRKLCIDVSKKEEASKKLGKYPNDNTLSDDNKVLSTPIDKVYEHGFYPLKGGFKAVVEESFEIVSQWIEVLPTDQIVPVEVEYDPISGRQKPVVPDETN